MIDLAAKAVKRPAPEVTAKQPTHWRFHAELPRQDMVFRGFLCPSQADSLAGAGAELATDSRVSQTPIVDKGFASVRKIGEGLYATISDPSKGYQTVCNGGSWLAKMARC